GRRGPAGVGSPRCEVRSTRLAHEVPGGPVELLSLPLGGVQPQGVPIGPVELRVDVEQALHVVVPRGDFPEARQRVPERRAVDYAGRTGRERRYVDAEERGAVALVPYLQAGLYVVAAAHEDVHAAGDRRGLECP